MYIICHIKLHTSNHNVNHNSESKNYNLEKRLSELLIR